MTLKQLQQSIIKYADLKHKFNPDYAQCLKEATEFYLRLYFRNNPPSSFKIAYMYH